MSPKPQQAPSELKWIEDRPSQTPAAKPAMDEFELVDKRTFLNVVLKKSEENVFVPLGLLATVTCLTLGLINMRQGNSAKQQLYMRGRVGFQAFTLAAMTIGVGLTGRKRDKV